MPQRAALRIGGPRTRSDRLYLHGFGPHTELRVRADGMPLGEIVLKKGDSPFIRSLTLPDQLVGRSEMEISIEAAQTFRVSGDGRDLAVAFSLIEVH